MSNLQKGKNIFTKEENVVSLEQELTNLRTRLKEVNDIIKMIVYDFDAQISDINTRKNHIVLQLERGITGLGNVSYQGQGTLGVDIGENNLSDTLTFLELEKINIKKNIVEVEEGIGKLNNQKA